MDFTTACVMNLLVLQLLVAATVPTSVGSLLAQADAAPVTTYTGVGTTTAAVGALVLVTQKIVKGDLVSRSTQDIDRRYEAIIGQLEDLSERLAGIAESAHRREQEYLGLLRDGYAGGRSADVGPR